jgi:hypothetical protein
VNDAKSGDTYAPMPVAGYTPQSASKIDLVNEGKALEERYLRWLEKVAAQTDVAADPRCLALARTHIQCGAMLAARSIFKPGRIALPEDVPAVQPDAPPHD